MEYGTGWPNINIEAYTRAMLAEIAEEIAAPSTQWMSEMMHFEAGDGELLNGARRELDGAGAGARVGGDGHRDVDEALTVMKMTQELAQAAEQRARAVLA